MHLTTDRGSRKHFDARDRSPSWPAEFGVVVNGKTSGYKVLGCVNCEYFTRRTGPLKSSRIKRCDADPGRFRRSAIDRKWSLERSQLRPSRWIVLGTPSE